MRESMLSSERTRELQRVRWLLLLVGAAGIVAGAILVAQPSHSLATLAVVLGIFVLLDGIAELVFAFRDEGQNRSLAVIVGVLTLIVGLLLVRHPTHAVSAIGLLIGIWLVCAGVLRLVRAMALADHRGGRLALSLLEIVIGIAIVANPNIGYTTLAVIAGIWLIVSGLGTITLAFVVKGAGSEVQSRGQRPRRKSARQAGSRSPRP
jgi:uncharacterized membrane protein HdeD (DUF308 family)